MRGPPVTPGVWGNCAWRFIHCVALGFPETPAPAQAAAYRAFLEGLAHTLPCPKCRADFARILRAHPLDERALAGPDELFAWTVGAHNLVNARLGRAPLSRRHVRHTFIFPAKPPGPAALAGAFAAGAAAALALAFAARLQKT